MDNVVDTAMTQYGVVGLALVILAKEFVTYVKTKKNGNGDYAADFAVMKTTMDNLAAGMGKLQVAQDQTTAVLGEVKVLLGQQVKLTEKMLDQRLAGTCPREKEAANG